MKALLACVMMLMVSGCSWLGYASDALGGGTTRDAVFKLRPQPTVVVVENWRNPGGAELDAERLAHDVYLNLRDHHVADQIDPSAVIDLRQRRSDFRTLSVAQIGKLAGARQVVYVNLTDTSMTGAMGDNSVTARATARVKVIDAESGEMIFPSDSMEGYPVSISTPMTVARDSGEESDLREKLIEAAANRIGALFYKTTEPD